MKRTSIKIKIKRTSMFGDAWDESLSRGHPNNQRGGIKHHSTLDGIFAVRGIRKIRDEKKAGRLIRD